MEMEFKKTIPILIAIMMIGTLIGVQAASAATSRIVIYKDFRHEVSYFDSNSKDPFLEIFARLYVDDDCRTMRCLTFDVYDPNGNQLIHITEHTRPHLRGFISIGIKKEDLSKWKTGDYTVTVSYPGNEAKGWPATSTTAVIHYTKL